MHRSFPHPFRGRQHRFLQQLLDEDELHDEREHEEEDDDESLLPDDQLLKDFFPCPIFLLLK